jgi:hypothetical protein
MEALPEQLRFDLEILSALRGTFKYQGPTRQLRLIDNPVNSLLILSARNLGLQRENQRLGVACFKAMLEAGRSESVAKQAEERAACGGIPVSLLEPDRTATITIDQALQEQLGSQDATCPRHIEAQEEASIRLESEP